MLLDTILTPLVKEASAQYSHLPDYEQKVQEHVEKLEQLFIILSKPVKPR